MGISATPVLQLAPDFMGQVSEGTYFTVNNAQTGIATAAAPTTFSDTNPFVAIRNNATPGGPSMYLDYLALVNTAIGTAAANVQLAVQIDPLVDRYTSGGTVLTSLIVNPNANFSNTSNALVRAGNITASAKTSAARMVVGNRFLKAAIPVVGDTYIVKFGAVDSPTFIGASAVVFTLQNVPKVVIPPQASCLIHLWFTSQSGASSYAPEMGWVER